MIRRHRVFQNSTLFALGGFLTVLLGTFNLTEAGEIRRQYHSVRALGMGNAALALSYDESALFYNPAGLANVKTFIFQLPIEVVYNSEASKQSSNITSLITKKKSLADVLSGLKGKDIYFRTLLDFDSQFGAGGYAPNYALAIPFGDRNSGFTLAAFYGGEQTIRFGVSSAGTQLTTESRRDHSLNLGLGFPLAQGKWLLGVTAQQIERCDKPSDNISVGKVTNLTDAICASADLRKGQALHAGIQRRVAMLGGLRITWALTAHNIGTLKFSRKSGETNPVDVPPEYGFGLSLQPKLGPIRWLIAADLRDLTKTHPDDTSCKTNSSYSCWKKRMHLGAELGFFTIDESSSVIAFRYGFNQGYPTKGIELNPLIFSKAINLQYAEYQVETATLYGTPETRKALRLSMEF